MKISQISVISIMLPGLMLGSSTAFAGPDWVEDGDAGRFIGDAQDTTSVGVLTSLAGTLGGADQEDVYRLTVLGSDDFAMPVSFSFMGGMDFNPSLWLFDSEGYGVLGNDDDPLTGGPGARLMTPSTDGVTIMLAPGDYYIACTESGNVPLSMLLPGAGKGSFAEIFSFVDQFEISGPDGAGANNPLAGWSGGNGSSGTYGIIITPAPSSVALLAVAGLVGRRNRQARGGQSAELA